MKRRYRGLLLTLVVATSVSVRAAAQEDAPAPPPDDSLTALGVPRRPWRNLASVVGGFTTQDLDGQSDGFTFGAEYERRLHKWYGVGAVAQWTIGGPREFLVGPVFTLHPTGPFRVGMVVAAEQAAGVWAFVYRLEFNYDFRLDEHWVIAPSLAVDFTRGRRILFIGVSLGRIFGTFAPPEH
jgi:hypothetical protein